jgi:signal transduction histidine kinase
VIPKPDGRRIWVTVSAAPIRAESGALLGAVATYTDITPLHELEEQREDFIRAITHDLRNPLTGILGHAQIVARSADRPDVVRNSADQIVANARRMGAMIADLIDSARLAANKFPLNRQPIDLVSFVRGLRESEVSAGAGERVEVESEAETLVADADAQCLDRILTNLLSNALKYSAAGSPVMIGIRQEGGEAVVTVRDRGIGIAPDDLPHIFERYYRAADTGRRRDSLGLGLHITRGLVAAHGGRIWVESEVGKGSTFGFSLPLASRPA